MLAVGQDSLVSEPVGGFDKLWEFWNAKPGWLFGFLSYEMRHDVENIATRFLHTLKEPALVFFRPSVLIEWEDDESKIKISAQEPIDKLWKSILEQRITPKPVPKPVHLKELVTKPTYFDVFKSFRQHIFEGDIYEVNYCLPYEASIADFDAMAFFEALQAAYPMPFGCLAKLGEWEIVSASPERFLKKIAQKLISQPIKGTIRKSLDPKENADLQAILRNSEKERAENMMIVDLVRNDLARCSEIGSTKVEELFGIYAFTNINQMISTVTSQLLPNMRFTDALRMAFPMGSMTGAPKIRAMELIDTYEHQARGIYSGAIGYVTPDADFDFSVLIRSVFYNQNQSYLYAQAGSALTYDAEAQAEYEECKLKIKPLLELLAGIKP